MTIELLIVSNTGGLAEALHGYEGLHVASLPSLARVKSIVASDQPPQAIYIEDTRGTLGELCDVIRATQGQHVPVLIGLQSVGMVHLSDFVDAGLPVTEARDAATLAEWIAELTGSASPIEFIDLPVDDPKVRRPDTTRAETRLGWRP